MSAVLRGNSWIAPATGQSGRSAQHKQTLQEFKLELRHRWIFRVAGAEPPDPKSWHLSLPLFLRSVLVDRGDQWNTIRHAAIQHRGDSEQLQLPIATISGLPLQLALSPLEKLRLNGLKEWRRLLFSGRSVVTSFHGM